jgi:flavin-dependent dehydrogenase
MAFLYNTSSSQAARHRVTAWFDGSRPLLRATLPEAAYGLSRYRLDAALAERFMALGGDLQVGKRFSGNAEEGVVIATGASGRCTSGTHAASAE